MLGHVRTMGSAVMCLVHLTIAVTVQALATLEIHVVSYTRCCFRSPDYCFYLSWKFPWLVIANTAFWLAKSYWWASVNTFWLVIANTAFLLAKSWWASVNTFLRLVCNTVEWKVHLFTSYKDRNTFRYFTVIWQLHQGILRMSSSPESTGSSCVVCPPPTMQL